MHSDGYRIEVKQPVKAADSISVLLIMSDSGISLLSIEAANGKPGKPRFAAFADDMKTAARESAIASWRIANQHAEEHEFHGR